MKNVLYCFLGYMLVAGCIANAETRSWTDYRGKKLTGEFVSHQGNVVTLKRESGEDLTIQFNRLSRADQIYIRQQSARPAGGAAPAVEVVPEKIEALFGDTLYNADKDKVSAAALKDKKIGLYFSAHWCPPCRKFTPMLVKAYNEMKADGKDFEIVFVSSDRSKKDMFNYMEETEMAWLAVSFKSDERAELKKRYGGSGIPKLVIIDDDGKVITSDARGHVSMDGAKAFKRW